MSERKNPDQTRERPAQISSEISSIESVDLDRFSGERLKSFPWPVELQGKGEHRSGDSMYVIRYPKGDIFLSFATLIHELGHPRQHEHRADLQNGEQTHENLFAEEEDAWTRGWDRFAKANPELLEQLRQRFLKHVEGGDIEHVSSFEQLYQWIKDGALKMVEMQRVLFEDNEVDPSINFDRLANEMEQAGVRDFLERYAEMRVGITIEDTDAQVAIKSTLESIEQEF